MIESLWLVLLGFAAGAAGSTVGFGGGIMIAPVLTFMGFPPSLVASSSLFGTFGNLGGATLTHALKRRIRYSLGLKLGLLSIPGTAFGALLAQYAKSDLFSVLLGIILAVSAYMLFRGNGKNDGEKKEEEEGPKKPDRLTRSMTLMMIMASISAGVVSSFFGIGGGVVIVPFMILVMGMRLKEVVVSSQPALLVIAFVGLAVHGFIGNTDIAQAVLLLIGGFGGGLVGVRLSQRLGGRHLQIILSALIAVAAIRLFWASIEEVYGSSISGGGSLFILHALHTWQQV